MPWHHCSTKVYKGALMNARIARKVGQAVLVRQNLRIARRSNEGPMGRVLIDRLRELTLEFGFSLALGDFTCLDGSWYVTHAGLLRLASRRRCVGIEVQHVFRILRPV